MFRYGLIGGITVYGGAAVMFGYIGWEMLNIAKLSVPIEEDLAKELFDSATAPRISVDQKMNERKISAKLYMENFNREKHAEKMEKQKT
ncbi:hypothetical protein pb186bvf_002924 [Paramecium bursaria]